MKYYLALLAAVLLLTSARAYECNYDIRGSFNSEPQKMNVETSTTPRRIKILIDSSTALLADGTHWEKCDGKDTLTSFGQKLTCEEKHTLQYSFKLNKTLSLLSQRVEREIGYLIDIVKPVDSISIPFSKNERQCGEAPILNDIYIPAKWAPMKQGYDTLLFVTRIDNISFYISRKTIRMIRDVAY